MRVDIKGVIAADEDGWIYDFFGYENTTPSVVKKAIEKARNEKANRLDVYINSGGGNLAAGTEIYSELASACIFDMKIHVIQACSAASVIMCAGKSDITPAGMVMIHNVSMAAEGDNRDMIHAAGVLKTADKAVASAYSVKSGRSMEEMLDLMSKETWLTAQQAVDLGLVDEIAVPMGQAIPQLAASMSGMIPQKMIEAMREKRMEAIAELELLKIRR